MKIIRFKRSGKENWEIAFNQENLDYKLNGEMAEVIMPAKSLFIRLWRKLFPLHLIKMEDYDTRRN
jgi:hypothetical protein